MAYTRAGASLLLAFVKTFVDCASRAECALSLLLLRHLLVSGLAESKISKIRHEDELAQKPHHGHTYRLSQIPKHQSTTSPRKALGSLAVPCFAFAKPLLIIPYRTVDEARRAGQLRSKREPSCPAACLVEPVARGVCAEMDAGEACVELRVDYARPRTRTYHGVSDRAKGKAAAG
ncbi:hypothetical protein C8Q73DRAFT_220157 [Cubamyces lactineus]|nr:hypothetical protein C8Q73DRAFT_220157 [Cubamyces lactineus]